MIGPTEILVLITLLIAIIVIPPLLGAKKKSVRKRQVGPSNSILRRFSWLQVSAIVWLVFPFISGRFGHIVDIMQGRVSGQIATSFILKMLAAYPAVFILLHLFTFVMLMFSTGWIKRIRTLRGWQWYAFLGTLTIIFLNILLYLWTSSEIDRVFTQ